MASSSSTELDSGGHRHCAYCLKSISGEEVKLCGKCGRRAYCSKECQVNDWKDSSKIKGQRGQGHKNWCDLRCGEEGIDWKVAPVEGKGLGLIALKPLPARSRIFVDACQISAYAHPATKDLVPEGATLEGKWLLNVMGCDDGDDPDDEKLVLALRMSRVNHSCSPNAMHLYCNTFKVKTLFAERDIAPGEEICIAYQSYIKHPSAAGRTSPEICALVLRTKYGIQCPKDCVCKDSKILGEVARAVELDKSIVNLASVGRAEQALRGVKALLTLYDGPLASSLLEKRRTLYDGFQIGIMKRNTLPQGLEYMKQLVGIGGDILHPTSAAMQKYLGFQKNPGSHRNYLIA